MEAKVYNDEDLMQAFQQGSNEALKHLFNLYYKPLLYFANKLIADLPEAEDVTADSFYKLYINRENFDSLPKIKAFLYMTNRNACLDFLKFKRRHLASHKEILYLSDTSDTTTKNKDGLVLRELRCQIQHLPKQCAAVFKMIWYEGKTTSEIAALLGISNKTVLNQKLKAVKLLKEALFKKGLLHVLALIISLH